MIDIEFIQRCQGKEFQEVVKDHHRQFRNKRNKWVNENRSRVNEWKNKYLQTEKGKGSSIKRSQTRRKREKILKSLLSRKQKEEIKEFYFNRPEGYHVDHIIPISKGGIHHISNLQYLKPKENLKKGSKKEKTVYNEPLFDKSQYLNKYH